MAIKAVNSALHTTSGRTDKSVLELYYRGIDKCSDFIDYCLSLYSDEAVAKTLLYCLFPAFDNQ